MSIEAINEQLLRAIGVGVALLDEGDLRCRFTNDTFRDWFGDIEPERSLGDLFPELDLPAVRAALGKDGRYVGETTFRMRRRTMTVAMTFNRALDAQERIVVLVCQNISRIKELESMIDSYSMMVERNTREIKREKEQVEKLLLNLMPRAVYEEYKTFGVVTPRLYDSVGVLCLDFHNFAVLVAAHDPGVIVSELNDIYTAFDRIGEQFGCERIKTVGDTYMTVSGMPDPADDFAKSACNAAVRFVRYLEQRNSSHPIQWQCRIGLAAGTVIGSVVGVQKYIYDVFGPAVMDASRLKESAPPMKIVSDQSIADRLDARFQVAPNGVLDIGNGSGRNVFVLDAVSGPGQAG
ncbi:MAG: adenylate/guanylate cyclase domain-containing protein [Hyphomonas sp.]|nr:adenylate/guanylate cyclase domain-containing protein [Hyphomonas sp.]MDP3460372.1 adenylate/guanylate cyclase domain-containing protein [Hyphomonas sp.]